MKAGIKVAITGIGIEVPGFDSLAELARGAEPNGKAFDPAAKLGKKGLRYKDQATKLAMCAAKTALLDAQLIGESEKYEGKPIFGAVASSNFGNVDTVCRTVETIRKTSVNDTGALDLPNASSNVVATTLAIRYGLTGLNLMVCNGHTSGLEAIYIAANCIRAGRAARMLVVGSEAGNDYVAKLLADSGLEGARALDGAAALILEDETLARERGAKIYGIVGAFASSSVAAVEDASRKLLAKVGKIDRWVASGQLAYHARTVATGVDVTEIAGPLVGSYGALGVFEVLLALEELRASGQRAALASCGGALGDTQAATLQVLHGSA